MPSTHSIRCIFLSSVCSKCCRKGGKAEPRGRGWWFGRTTTPVPAVPLFKSARMGNARDRRPAASRSRCRKRRKRIPPKKHFRNPEERSCTRPCGFSAQSSPPGNDSGIPSRPDVLPPSALPAGNRSAHCCRSTGDPGKAGAAQERPQLPSPDFMRTSRESQPFRIRESMERPIPGAPEQKPSRL
jgi:hypothetical protein